MKISKMRILVLAALCVTSLLVLGGEIATYHRAQPSDKSNASRNFRSLEEIDSDSHGISEFGIEHDSGIMGGPSFTFMVKRSGRFRFVGVKGVEPKGEFTGKIPAQSFHLLAQFIRDSDFMSLENSYKLPATDQAEVYTTVVMNGKRKTILNYGNAGPTKLWAIEELIKKLRSDAKWDSPSKVPGKQQ